MKILETERLILRPWTKDDAQDVFAYAKNPNVGPHGGWKPHENIEESMKIIDSLFIGQYHSFAIEWKETKKVIGFVGFEADSKRPEVNCLELGYALSEEYWGLGIMTEAVKVAIGYAFSELKVDFVSVYRNPHNKRSGRVIEKCGFIYEGTLRNANKIYDGTIRDIACFSLTKKEYEAFEKREKKKKKVGHYAYLLRCADGTYYGGWTTDLEARVKTHNSGLGAKYTRGRGPVKLVYYEAFFTRQEAMKREIQLKKMSRAQKEKLIASSSKCKEKL